MSTDILIKFMQHIENSQILKNTHKYSQMLMMYFS